MFGFYGEDTQSHVSHLIFECIVKSFFLSYEAPGARVSHLCLGSMVSAFNPMFLISFFECIAKSFCFLSSLG